jgi:phosphocarrier protein HPr
MVALGKRNYFLNFFFVFSPIPHSYQLRMSDSGDMQKQSSASFTLEVSNKMGVHARPAAMIVRIASRHEGEVWVTKEAERVNAKSIMGIMMLAAAKGTELKFEVSGAEIENLKKEMTQLFASKFQDE